MQTSNSHENRAATYCNPMDLPYRFMLEGVSRREAADPTLVVFEGEYWLFPSKTGGYWHSSDLKHWKFVATVDYPVEQYAPTVLTMDGKLYVTAFNLHKLYVADDLKAGRWSEAGDFGRGFPDPALFQDDDGRLYMYGGCSPRDFLHAAEIDPKNGFKAGPLVDVPASRSPATRGWEVRGDHNDEPQYESWLEGAWVNKHNGKYYLQYAGAGTQFKTYGDGVLVSDHPMGPFTYADYSPFSFKPTGFITGAGHGSTFAGLDGRYWHIVTSVVSVRHDFERRLSLFPTHWTDDGQMMTDTYLGDYPRYLGGNRALTGWMLLSRKKSVTASSSLTGHVPEQAVDEDVKTWWSAQTGDHGEWLQIDLGAPKRVEAVQINFGDEGSTTLGYSDGPYLYRLEASTDGTNWQPLIDHRQDGRDAPHDYEVLPSAVETRYLRLTNVRTPNNAKFSVSGLRVFGSGGGSAPRQVGGVTATRDTADPRHVTVHWQSVPNTDFYIVRLGTRTDRLTQNYQIYDTTTAEIRSLNTGVAYHVTVDAVNENGVTQGVKTVEIAADSGAPVAPTNIVVRPGQKIAFLGASITQFGWQHPHGYVRTVVDTLAKNGVTIVPIPAGVSGNTSRDMLKRLSHDVLGQKPDWMTVDAGGNDVWHNSVQFDEYKSNMTAIVEQAQAAGIKVILQTCTPIMEDLDGDFNRKLALYNDFQRDLAKQKGCLLADLNADSVTALKAKTGNNNLLTTDGVHMNDRGNNLMASGLLRILGMTDSQIALGVHPTPSAGGDTSSGFGAPASDIPHFPGTDFDFHGYAGRAFTVDGCGAKVVAPKTPLPGHPWVWRTMFWDAFPKADIALLERGFYVAFIDVGNTFGCPDAMKHFDAFYAEMTSKYDLSQKPALEGLSRGGLYAYRWAYVNTDKVGCIYGDAPVCDMKSWPGGKGKGPGSPSDWQKAIHDYHFANEAEMMTFTGNPIDTLAPIAAAHIPIIHVYGDSDSALPYTENTTILHDRYVKLGGPIALIEKTGCDHHPHGLNDPTPVVNFITAYCAEGEAARKALPLAPKPGSVTVLAKGQW